MSQPAAAPEQAAPSPPVVPSAAPEQAAPSPAVEPATAPAALDSGMREVLGKELDLLYNLYTQTETSLQATFNYYMGLITTITGAIIVVLQLNPAGVPSGQANLTVCGLLGFATLVGAIYLSSLSGKYAHMARYAHGIDALRRLLLSSQGTPPLELYQTFASQLAGQVERQRGLAMLFPAGTYTFFIAAVNTAALATGMLLFIDSRGVPAARGALSVAICALLLFTCHNLYSHLVINAITTRFSVHVYIQNRLPFLSGKV